jgi:hypothetical protein
MGTISVKERAAGLLTTGEVARALGLSLAQVRWRVKIGVLPRPVRVKADGTPLFDRVWLKEARRSLGKDRRKAKEQP